MQVHARNTVVSIHSWILYYIPNKIFSFNSWSFDTTTQDASTSSEDTTIDKEYVLTTYNTKHIWDYISRGF